MHVSKLCIRFDQLKDEATKIKVTLAATSWSFITSFTILRWVYTYSPASSKQKYKSSELNSKMIGEREPLSIIKAAIGPKILDSKQLGPLHTQDREPVTITLQALSLVEKAELVQVCFSLRLRDQHSK
jgi:hypothetical protein